MDYVNHKLRIRSFGGFDIVYKDKSIFIDSNLHKAIDLIEFLFYNKDLSFTEEEILEKVWPHEIDGKPKKTFTNILRNAQKIIAFDNFYKRDFSQYISIYEKDSQYGIMFGDDVSIDSDILVSQLETVRNKGDTASLMQSFKSVTNIITKVSPASDTSKEWIDNYRHFYLDVYARTVECIADKLIQQGRMKDLEQIKTKCLEISESDTSILNALIRNGTMKKVLATYVTDEELRRKTDLTKQPAPGYCSEREFEDNFEFSDLRGDLLRKFISEAIKDYMADYGSKYYIALIEIEKDESMTEYERKEFDKLTESQLRETINRTLLSVLRKRDMYVIFRKNLAIAILYGVRPEYIDSLKNRIGSVFIKNIEHNIRLDIQILQVVDVE